MSRKKHSKRHKTTAKTEWIFGLHSAESCVTRTPERILEVFLDAGRRDARMQKMQIALQDKNIAFKVVSKRELNNLVEGNHQGVVIKARTAQQKSEKALYQLLAALKHPPFLLVLDQITDPHNLGACLRTADGAGVEAVILPKDGACPINETVRRVASGAAENVNVFYVSNLARCLKEIKKQGVWVVGLADNAEQNLNQVDLQPPLAVVLGAESKGMRKLTRDLCDQLISIPMQGAVSSLNVSVATGVVLYAVKTD